MLAVGNLWMFLLKFPAQSRTTANTTSDQPGFHWCTLMSWFHMLDHCADEELFFAENIAPSSFCLCLSFPKTASVTIFWSCVLPQIWDSDYTTALLSYTNFQFYLFIAQALCSRVWEVQMPSVSWPFPKCASPLSPLLPHFLLHLNTIPSWS